MGQVEWRSRRSSESPLGKSRQAGDDCRSDKGSWVTWIETLNGTCGDQSSTRCRLLCSEGYVSGRAFGSHHRSVVAQ